MSFENRPEADKILTTVEFGLRDFVIRHYKQTYKGKKYLSELSEALQVDPPLGSEVQARSEIESPGWLLAILRRKEAFQTKIGGNHQVKNPEAKQGFNFVHSLLAARNRYAHWSECNGFNEEDVYSLADDATRLLRVVGAKAAAAITEEIQKRYGEILFGEANEDTADASPTENNSADPPNGNDDGGDSASFSSKHEGEPIAYQVDLTGASLPNLDWRGRNLKGAKLHKTDLSKGIFCEEDLSQLSFDRVNLWSAKLRNTILRGSKFYEVDLRKADLTAADLRGATLTQPKLSNAIFAGAKLQGVSIERTKLSYWKMGQLKATIDLSNIDMTGARLADVEFSGVDMSNAVLTDASFLAEDIKWLADHGAWQRLEFEEETYKPKPCRLFRANLTGSDLTRATAAKVNLKESKLEKANLTGANLQGAYLNEANLTEAVLCECNLILTDLASADLRGADLTDARLYGASLESVKFGYSTKLPDGTYWNGDTDMSKFTDWPPPAQPTNPPH